MNSVRIDSRSIPGEAEARHKMNLERQTDVEQLMPQQQKVHKGKDKYI
jgi:hypothetical protein